MTYLADRIRAIAALPTQDALMELRRIAGQVQRMEMVIDEMVGDA